MGGSPWGLYRESTRSLRTVYEESTESLCGIHETVFHGVLMESSLFQTVPLDSMWSLWRLHMDSTRSLWRLLGISGKCSMESSQTLHGVSMESPWSPCRLYVESMWTPWSLHGLHGNVWVSVKYSISTKTHHVKKLFGNLQLQAY